MKTRQRGFHARVSGTPCAKCHPDHAGRDFQMVVWEEGSPAKFDHRRAGFLLDGKHAALECRACHKPALQRSGAVSLVRVTGRARSWLGLETSCVSCHQDPHQDRFGAACERCHSARDWQGVKAGTFDHDRTRYPLRGRHAALECARCHASRPAWRERPPFASCGACHADPHGGEATIAGRRADCAACHDVNRFKPSTFTLAEHRTTAYPLEGGHARAGCAACHPKRPAPGKAVSDSARIMFRPPHARCTDCHSDAHGGQLLSRPDRGRCEPCHTPREWKPSSFTARDHESLPFALRGRHAEISCDACHSATRPGLPPPEAAAGTRPAGFVFALRDRECAACHNDPHRGRFAAGGPRTRVDGCLACHDHVRFRPSKVEVATHATYRFALEGAHRAEPCQGCHAELKAAPPVSSLALSGRGARPLMFEDQAGCAGCHPDPHGGQFEARRDSGACDACHDVERFAPAARFDHDRDAAFRLEGAHARVRCAACHRSVRLAGGRTRVIYRPTPARCAECHARNPERRQGSGRLPRRRGRTNRGPIPVAAREASRDAGAR